MTMRMKMFALIALAAAAFAQGPPPGRGGRGRMGFDGPAGAGGPLESGAWILRGGVKNSPFSADVVTESSLTLADGNHIRQTVNSKVYRDSEGRTRREQAVNLNGLAPSTGTQQMVFINDPVAGLSYSLNAKDHTGTKFVRNGDGRGGQHLSTDASGSRPRGLGPDGRGMGRRNAAADQNLKTESLGRQTIEGVQAEGRRTTMTIPGRSGGKRFAAAYRRRDLVLTGTSDYDTFQALGSAQWRDRNPAGQHQPQRTAARPVRSAGRLQGQRVRFRYAAAARRTRAVVEAVARLAGHMRGMAA